jgi:transcriptional regulator with XRE-family HTH domain
MQTVNPNMIILARESRGLTQSQLAASIGIPQGRLSKIEKGILIANDNEIKLLSKYLQYPESIYYVSGERYPLQMNYYRKFKNIPKGVL